jgi:uncharacterized protein GlcG (DUF336 family)
MRELVDVAGKLYPARVPPIQFHFQDQLGDAPMIRSFAMLGALALAATSNFALAQQGGQQPPARAPEMALALEAALSACAANGVKAVASVVDSAGVLRLLLAADGASNNSIEISQKKAFTANALKTTTSEVAEKMQKDQTFKVKIEADKTLWPRPGGLPLVVGNDVIGAIGVSGASSLNGVPGGVRDEGCAKAGLEKIKARLK